MKKIKNLSTRKHHHLGLSGVSQLSSGQKDSRFYYEPLLGVHPSATDVTQAKKIAPLWISSMTGGTSAALAINQRLGKAAKLFNLEMGLGSCRPLFEENLKSLKANSAKVWSQFNLTKIMPTHTNLWANIGWAQLCILVKEKRLNLLEELVSRLQVKGLIIHLNPLQEWHQAEGDRFCDDPKNILDELFKISKQKFILKEVGQGFGPQSISLVLDYPFYGLDLAGFGGTNFSYLEVLRNSNKKEKSPLCFVGHDLNEMLPWFFQEAQVKKIKKLPKLILSGGIKNYLDGFYYYSLAEAYYLEYLPHLAVSKPLDCAYAQAQAFLSVAQTSQASLNRYVDEQISGFKMAQNYLRIRK